MQVVQSVYQYVDTDDEAASLHGLSATRGWGRHRQATGFLGVHPSLRAGASSGPVVARVLAKVEVVPGFAASHYGDAGGDLRRRDHAAGRHGRIRGTSRSYAVPGCSPPLSMLWDLFDSCGELGRSQDVARKLRASEADNHIYAMEAHAELPVGAGRSVGQAPSTPTVRPRVLPRSASSVAASDIASEGSLTVRPRAPA